MHLFYLVALVYFTLWGSLLKTDAFDLVMQEITPSNLLMISAILILYYLHLSSAPLHVWNDWHKSHFGSISQVDGSTVSKQGLRFVFTDGSRIIFRLSVHLLLRFLKIYKICWRLIYNNLIKYALVGNRICWSYYPPLHRTIWIWYLKA